VNTYRYHLHSLGTCAGDRGSKLAFGSQNRQQAGERLAYTRDEHIGGELPGRSLNRASPTATMVRQANGG